MKDIRVDNEMYEMEEVLQDRDYFAKYLSENNIYLERCLKMLWNLDIHTKACCKGHKDEIVDKQYLHRPYILINITSDTEDLIFNITKRLHKIVNGLDSSIYNLSFKPEDYYIHYSTRDVDDILFCGLIKVMEDIINE